MKNFKELFHSSYLELKNVRSIATAAMFGAISIVLGVFTIMIGDFLKIGFTYLPNNFIFYLFGPVFGAVYGAAMDILTFIVKPTGAFFYGFTVSAALKGLLFGTILYRKPISLKRIFIANLLRVIFISILLDTYWLTLLNGDAFLALLPVRALKNLILLPIETFLLFGLIKAVDASGVLRVLKRGRAKA
ncbi:folate family ECF transporter S component [Lachnospiraceae bacterium MD1]|uniref:Folate family ECF transporter S component n=1 Tax=Variimorphobacter saccharofermentans TaxID=2755051 RepID=A0A839JWA5_9FIRM|nr:folate family ECF transporter S component [Variimorphobacter saccharofermentans]MBB2181518.1 folate family ECF transporter S component [Variimorphobacter saccharofermentans]